MTIRQQRGQLGVGGTLITTQLPISCTAGFTHHQQQAQRSLRALVAGTQGGVLANDFEGFLLMRDLIYRQAHTGVEAVHGVDHVTDLFVVTHHRREILKNQQGGADRHTETHDREQHVLKEPLDGRGTSQRAR